MSATFPYEPLDTAKSEIRVLKLPPTGSDVFELITVSLDDNPEYAALSYVWGDPQDQEIITVQGHKIGVTKNLAAALSRIRRGKSCYQTDYLWADAICIDQTNLVERSLQVQLMRRIYTLALGAYSWVGPSDHTLAFETLAILAGEVRKNYGDRCYSEITIFQLDWLRQYPKLCDPRDDSESSPTNNPWQAVHSLAFERYWKRVWVFQEIALARRLLLLSSGDTVLDWEDVHLAASSISRASSEIDHTRLRKPHFISDYAWSFIDDFCIWRIFDMLQMGRLYTQSPQLGLQMGRLHTQSPPLGWIMSTFSIYLEASDPKDYIYGLLGVTKIPISPDYRPEKPVSELYMEYVAGFIDATWGNEGGYMRKPLSFLSVAGVGFFGHSDMLPSWVPNYPENARRVMPKTFMSASIEATPTNFCHRPYVLKDTQSLFVWARKMRTVDVISEGLDCNRLRDFHYFLESFASRDAYYISGAPSLQAVARLVMASESKAITRGIVEMVIGFAFLANEVRAGTAQELPWHHEWETRLYELAFPGIDMKELGLDRDPQREILSWKTEETKEFLHRLDLTLRHANYFELKGGHLGRGPLGARSGDTVCVIEGYDLPVLLRTADEGHYILVGVATVLDVDIDSQQDLGPEAGWLELR